MKRVTSLILLLVIVAGCRKEVSREYFTNEKAVAYFSQVEEICNLDNGALWGENLYGPIMIVDYDSRRVFANFPDDEGILKSKEGIYTGTYPKEEVISNYAVEFGNTLFAMAPLPREENPNRIITRCLHGLFHCFQIRNDLNRADYNTSHMDEKTARLYLKLEWKALERAINTPGSARVNAIRDALVFRTARREMYPDFIEDENIFEFHEGLATFTYYLLGSEDYDDYTRNIMDNLHRLYSVRSFSRTFGFTSGSLYAYLLNESGFDFKTLKSPDIDLGELSREIYDISLPEISRDVAGSLALNYDLDVIQAEEKERDESRNDRFRRRIAQYTERPVVYLELESPNFSFEPEDIDPVDSLGVIYQSLRVSDNWGKISIDEGGCLVSNNLKFMRVPAREIKTDRNHISGDGWELILDSNWEMVKVDENFYIQKLIP